MALGEWEQWVSAYHIMDINRAIINTSTHVTLTAATRWHWVSAETRMSQVRIISWKMCIHQTHPLIWRWRPPPGGDADWQIMVNVWATQNVWVVQGPSTTGVSDGFLLRWEWENLWWVSTLIDIEISEGFDLQQNWNEWKVVWPTPTWNEWQGFIPTLKLECVKWVWTLTRIRMSESWRVQPSPKLEWVNLKGFSLPLKLECVKKGFNPHQN